MVRAQISGFTVLSGSRILVPSQIATIEPTVKLPVVGTLELVIEMATVGTIVSGAITASIEGGVTDLTRYVGTVDRVGTIQGGVIHEIGTIKSGIINRVEAIDQLGSIAEGKLTASVSGGVINQVGSISEGKVTASISGGKVDEIGTITSGKVAIATVGVEIDPRNIRRLTVVDDWVSILRGYEVATIASGGSLIGMQAATIEVLRHSELGVDFYAGSITAGSVQIRVERLEPQSGNPTELLASSEWLAPTSPMGTAIALTSPLGNLARAVVDIVGTLWEPYITVTAKG